MPRPHVPIGLEEVGIGGPIPESAAIAARRELRTGAEADEPWKPEDRKEQRILRWTARRMKLDETFSDIATTSPIASVVPDSYSVATPTHYSPTFERILAQQMRRQRLSP